MIKNIPLKEIMITDVAVVHENDPFSIVDEKFKLRKIRHLPVIDKDGKLKGIISERDLYRTTAPRKTESGYIYDRKQLDDFILKFVMTPEPFSLGPESTLKEALEAMVIHHYGCVPVVSKDGILKGLITRSNVLALVLKQLSA